MMVVGPMSTDAGVNRMLPRQAATAPHRAREREAASIRLVCAGLLTMTIVTHP